jgi:hypothetical protein
MKLKTQKAVEKRVDEILGKAVYRLRNADPTSDIAIRLHHELVALYYRTLCHYLDHWEKKLENDPKNRHYQKMVDQSLHACTYASHTYLV